RDVENDRGGLPVNVAARAKRRHEGLVAGEVREQSQLDLGIVGGDEAPAGPGNEAATDVAAQFGPDGDVLQIRIARRQASRRGDRLVEGRVDAVRLGVDQ